MQAVILTKKELNDLLVGTINLLSSAKNTKYQKQVKDHHGLFYDNHESDAEWNKKQKEYINRINKLRKKIGEEYLS